MIRGRGPVRLVVRSRRVPVALTEVEFSHTSSYGVAYNTKKRLIVYDYVLDEGERRILEEVRRAAENSGLSLEVVDLGRAGPFRRIASRLLERLAEGPRIFPRATRFVAPPDWPSSAIHDQSGTHNMRRDEMWCDPSGGGRYGFLGFLEGGTASRLAPASIRLPSE